MFRLAQDCPGIEIDPASGRFVIDPRAVWRTFVEREAGKRFFLERMDKILSQIGRGSDEFLIEVPLAVEAEGEERVARFPLTVQVVGPRAPLLEPR